MIGFFTAFGAGVLFALGLFLGGMVSPAKVLAFLDFAGDWDMQLAFVMGGAVLVYAPLFHVIVRRKWPFFGVAFDLPSARHIDPRLLGGAALFGVGWGLAGLCPGPALVAAGGALAPALVFVTTMAVGALSFRWVDQNLLAPRKTKAPSPTPQLKSEA
jgi:hypothetical protein